MERLRNDMCDVVNASCVLYSPLACRSSRVVIARDSIVTGALTDPQSFCGGCHLCSQALKLRSAIAACVTFSLVQPPQCPLRPCLPTHVMSMLNGQTWLFTRTCIRHSSGEEDVPMPDLAVSKNLSCRCWETLRSDCSQEWCQH